MRRFNEYLDLWQLDRSGWRELNGFRGLGDFVRLTVALNQCFGSFGGVVGQTWLSRLSPALELWHQRQSLVDFIAFAGIGQLAHGADPLHADFKSISARFTMPDFGEHHMPFRLQHDDLVD